MTGTGTEAAKTKRDASEEASLSSLFGEKTDGG
jgi:hypothetical protein